MRLAFVTLRGSADENDRRKVALSSPPVFRALNPSAHACVFFCLWRGLRLRLSRQAAVSICHAMIVYTLHRSHSPAN